MNNRNKKRVIAILSVLSASAVGVGIASSHAKFAAAETTEKQAVLAYDFSSENVTGNAVKSVGSSATQGSIFFGTGLTVANGELVFNQPGDVSEADAAKKGYFQLPVGALDGLTSFTLQVDVADMVGPDDRDPFLAITPRQIVEGCAFGDSNKGVLIGDGWIDNANYTFMECYFPNWTCLKAQDKPFTEGLGGVLSLIFNGSTLSFWCNDTRLMETTVGNLQNFNDYDYIKLGGMFYTWTGGLQARMDNVKLYDYARTEAQLIADKEAFFEAQKPTATGATAKVYYDFSEADENGVVDNLGSGKNMNGQIVQTKNDVYIQNGKLVIKNGETVDKANGYFRLPDSLFADTADWTMEIKVDYLDIHGDKNTSFLSFAQDDPSVFGTEAGKNNNVQIAWTWESGVAKMVPFYQGTIDANSGNLWKTGTTDIATKIKEEEKTLYIINKGGVLTFYYNDVVLFKTDKYDDVNYYKQFTFNRIGGYLYDWGRSSSDITIDSFAFYDYARSPYASVNFNGEIEEVHADLSSSAMSIDKFVAYDRSGNVVENAQISISNVDYTTVGQKEYVASVSGQFTPARLTLRTRDLLAFSDSIVVTSTTPELPKTLEFTYSDNSKVELPVVWENYTFKIGEQTVTAIVTDAQGRTATATLTVVGERGSVGELESLIAEIENHELTSVTSSYEAMLEKIGAKYEAAKAFIQNPQDDTELDAIYEALKSAYETAKSLLIEIAPINEALGVYGNSAIVPFAREEEALAYQTAVETLTAMQAACASVAERDAAIENLADTYNALFVAAENTGFGGYTELENGLSEIQVKRPPSNYWSVRQAISYTVTGDFEFSATIKDYQKNLGATSWFALTLLTVNGTAIMYEVGLNDYEADANYPNGSPFAVVNINWNYPANVDGKAENGVFPATPNPSTNWYTPVNDSEDTFTTSNPFDVKIWRDASENRYYFALMQGGKVCYAFYNVIQDMSDVYVCLGSTEAEATVTDICLKGAVNPWNVPATGEVWKGLEGVATDGFYDVTTSDRIYENGTLVANDKLYSFDFSIQSADNGKNEAGLSIGFVYKSGYIYDKLALRFGETTSAEFYLTGSLSTVKETFTESLALNKTYRLAILMNVNGDYNILSMYVYDQEGRLVYQSKEYSMYNMQPLAISLKAEGVTYKVSALKSNNISGLSIGGLDYSIYSPDSVTKYKARLEEIGLSIYDLSNDSQETLANKIQQFKEAKNLLELAKVIGLVTPFDPIEVELNATKVVLPIRARVEYDNGKVANLIVQWEKVDTSKVGRIYVRGTVYDADGNSTGCVIECPVDIVKYGGGGEDKKSSSGCSSSVAEFGAYVMFAGLGAVGLLNKKRRRK